MKSSSIVCLVLSLLSLHGRGEDEDWPVPEVTLSTGKVRGLRVVSAVHRVYYSFRGIPYAAPPVGQLRFKAPRPPASWNDTLDAFDIPASCAQPWRKLDYPERYREDCLYINVYTPYIKPPQDKPMPVMVWIHGGKHFEGSSTSYKYGPDFLVTEDIVLVSFNYRLGVFGYFNSNSSDAQGNAAGKDKVAALKWVQKEISHFGGDPNSVTIFGGSSGGSDVECLYLSPMARGLFNKAISQSGMGCSTSSHDMTVRAGQELAKMLGCSSPDTKEGMACLRAISADELAEFQMEVVNPGGPENLFHITLESQFGEEPFFGESAEELLTYSESDIPYMIGLNSGEGKMFISDPAESPTQFIDIERDFKSHLPKYILENASMKLTKKIVKELKQFYFGDKPISEETALQLSQFLMDSKFAYTIIEDAKAVSLQAPVYLYYFVFEGEFVQYFSSDVLNIPGVGHGQELGYLFHRSMVVPEQSHLYDYPRECQMITKMVKLWTNFAKYGNPTPDAPDTLLNATWLPVNVTWTRHLVINDTLTMEPRPLLEERMAEWEKVFDWVTPSDERRIESYLILGFVSSLALISLIFLIYDSFCTSTYEKI